MDPSLKTELQTERGEKAETTPFWSAARHFEKLWRTPHIVLILFIFLFLYFASQIAAFFLAGGGIDLDTGGMASEGDPFLLVLYALAGSLLASIIAVLGVNAIMTRHSWEKLGLGHIPRRWVMPAIYAGVIAAGVRVGIIVGLFELFPALEEGAAVLEEAFVFEETWKMVVVGLLATFIVPVYEELFFRGFVHNALGNRLKFWPAILLSSLIFGLFHLIPAQIITAFLLGIVLGWLYERSGSLWIAILCHLVNNGVAMLLTFFTV